VPYVHVKVLDLRLNHPTLRLGPRNPPHQSRRLGGELLLMAAAKDANLQLRSLLLYQREGHRGIHVILGLRSGTTN
jgi:hypothetical protein